MAILVYMNPSNDFGASLASDAKNQGQSAVSNFDPTAVANTQRGNTNTLFNTQQGQAQNYVGQYANQVAQNPTVTSLYNQGNTMFNVPEQQKQATYLQNQVSNAAPNAYQLARGFDVSDPQVQNQINTNLRFLQPAANAATANAQQAEQLAQGYVGAGIQQNLQNLLPIQSEAPLLQQNLAAMATGWNQANQGELNGLIQKMQSGVALSQQEMDRANTLAQQETAYQNQLTQTGGTIGAAKIAAQNQVIAPGSTYYNPATNYGYNPLLPITQPT